MRSRYMLLHLYLTDLDVVEVKAALIKALPGILSRGGWSKKSETAFQKASNKAIRDKYNSTNPCVPPTVSQLLITFRCKSGLRSCLESRRLVDPSQTRGVGGPEGGGSCGKLEESAQKVKRREEKG